MRRASLLVAAGTCALLLLLIVILTGGFTIRAGPLYFASHGWRGPLLVVLAAFGGLAVFERASVPVATSAVWQFAADHAAALAVLIAAATAGAGVAHGTYSASSSDASGYVSEARLFGALQVADDEPLARVVAWPNATWAFSPLGYRPGAASGELVPTYPAGLPLVIAPVQRLAGELAAYLVVPFLGALAVLATYSLGARLHSPLAGLAAATLLATSPVFLFQLVQPMSDVAVTAWWAIAFLWAVSSLPGSALAAGAAAGMAVLTRPNLAPLAGVVAVAAINWPLDGGDRRVRLHKMLALSAGILPALTALVVMQWRLYGNPLLSGYGSAGDLFEAANIGPNLLAYGQRILRGEAPALGLAVFAITILAVRRESAAGDAPPVTRPLVLAALAFAIVAASYLPYAVFTEWSYLRFLLPAFPLVFVLVGALLVNALVRLPPAARGLALVAVLAMAGSCNVNRAREEQAFNLQRFESRYRLAGRYLRETLPRDFVIVAAQESGGARYYARLPILRWDLIGVDLDSALATLQAIGRHPVLLVEDWEVADLQKRFPASAIARLDWQPRAEFGDETRVRLFDPQDRGSSREWLPDRVH